jgi:NitT/TauT family transport system ATP-binding protein
VLHPSSRADGVEVELAPETTPAIVELRAVGLSFAGRPPVQVLEGVDLTVPRGSFVSLIGPSGCGKSTLLRVVAGILQATSGTVLVEGGSPLAAQRAHRFGFVFQDAALLPWRSVQENVELLGELVGLPPAERHAQASALLSLVGLAGREHLRPSQLSGGMRQRVAIARALAINPSILLMDEPFSAVDEFQRENLNIELLRIWTEQQNSVLFVTHNIEEAVFLSDYVCVMSPNRGKIVEFLPVELERPRPNEVRVSPEFLALRRHLREVLVR